MGALGKYEVYSERDRRWKALGGWVSVDVGLSVHTLLSFLSVLVIKHFRCARDGETARILHCMPNVRFPADNYNAEPGHIWLVQRCSNQVPLHLR